MTTAGGEPPIAPLRGVASAGSWRSWCCLPAKHPLTRATGHPTPDSPPSPHHCLSLLAGPRTPREPGLFRLSYLLLRSTPPRERGFVNLILLRTSKKITIPNGGRARAAPENDPDCHVSADIRAAGGSTSAVTLGWSLFAACCNPGGSMGPLREPLLAALRYTHRKQLKASFPGCAGFGRCGVPSALVWRAARPLLPLLSGSPACWGARAVLTAPRATSVGPAGAPRRRFGARNLPPTRQARGSCRRCLSKRAHAC